MKTEQEKLYDLIDVLSPEIGASTAQGLLNQVNKAINEATAKTKPPTPKQIANVLYNNLGLSKEAMIKAVIEGANEVGKREAQRIVQSNDNLITKAVATAVDAVLSKINLGNRFDGNTLTNLVNKEIAKQLEGKIQITIKS